MEGEPAPAAQEHAGSVEQAEHTKVEALRAVVLTLGGEREAAMREQLAAVGGFDALFVEGISARSLRNQEGLKAALRAAGIFGDAGQAGREVDDAGIALLTEAQEEAAAVEMWRRSKSLSRDRSVLACVLAHLHVLRIAEQEKRPLVIEDNARLIAKPGESAARARKALEAAQDAPLLMLGYGGSEDAWKEMQRPVAAVPWREKPLVWGTQCYRLEPAARHRLVAWLRGGVESLLPARGKHCRGFKPRPIDRLLTAPFVAEGRAVMASLPVAYRAPMLRSLIHEQWDASMSEATEKQMVATGDSFDDLWLTEEERSAVAHRCTQGSWTHCDGITRENWVRKPRRQTIPVAGKLKIEEQQSRKLTMPVADDTGSREADDTGGSMEADDTCSREASTECTS